MEILSVLKFWMEVILNINNTRPLQAHHFLAVLPWVVYLTSLCHFHSRENRTESSQTPRPRPWFRNEMS